MITGENTVIIPSEMKVKNWSKIMTITCDKRSIEVNCQGLLGKMSYVFVPADCIAF